MFPAFKARSRLPVEVGGEGFKLSGVSTGDNHSETGLFPNDLTLIMMLTEVDRDLIKSDASAVPSMPVG